MSAVAATDLGMPAADANALATEATVCLSAGETRRCVQLADRALEIDPGYVRALRLLLRGLYRERDLPRALDVAERLANGDGEEQREGQLYLARIADLMNDQTRAIELWRSAVAAMPDSADARAGLASALLKAGHLAEASIEAAACLELKPNHAGAQRTREQSLELANKNASDLAGQKKDDRADKAKTLAIVHARKTLAVDADAALKLTRDLVVAYPDDVTIEVLHGRALIATRHFDEARTILERSCRRPDATADAFFQYARSCRINRDVENAIGACFDALARQNEHSGALKLLSSLLPAQS